MMHHQQFLCFIWFCLQIGGCISFGIRLSHEFSECHLWDKVFKLCMSVPYVVDQAFKMRSRLLLYWPRSKWRDLLCWVEYLPCNDYLALPFPSTYWKTIASTLPWISFFYSRFPYAKRKEKIFCIQLWKNYIVEQALCLMVMFHFILPFRTCWILKN